MRITVIFIALLSFISAPAQKTMTLSYDGSRLLNHTFYHNGDTKGKGISYDDIQGTPYYNKAFLPAKFISPGNTETALARYNTYFDEVEFKKGEEAYSLIPESPFSRIEFQTKETLVRLDNGADLKGYYFELAAGKNSLYKKVKTEFKDAVSAKNSYDLDRPAQFNAIHPVYYIVTESGFIKDPKKLKDITDAFPARKADIEKFAKSSNIKLSKEEDIIKLTNFLNQN